MRRIRMPSEAASSDAVSSAVEAVDTALERLVDSGSLPAFDVVVAKINAILEDGTADFPESDVRRILAEVLAGRLFRTVGARVYREGVFSEAD